MSKKISQHQKSIPPSRRVYEKHLQVPAGCVDVWRINTVLNNPQGKYRKDTTNIHSQWLDREACMKMADRLWQERRQGSDLKMFYHVYVEHKAAITLNSEWHIVNIPSFQPCEVVTPEPDDPWIAEYDRTEMAGKDHVQ